MEKRELFWIGEWISPNDLLISENRAFLYGDGFFESMRWLPDLTCLLWDFHWDRIFRTFHALNFPVPEFFTETWFKNLLQNQIAQNSKHDWRVKVVFWRQGGGKYQPENARLAFMATIEPMESPWIQTIENVGIAESVFIPKHPLSWIKTTSSMLYVAAATERVNRNLDDLILRNEQGYVIEGSYSCLFWAKSDTIFLPDSSLGGLDSCMRKFLVLYWHKKGFRVQMVQEKWSDIPDVDWIGFGSGMGLRILPINRKVDFCNALPAFT